MWNFTHFWYLFCVILHIFHTWVHNYGTKILKIRQRNKLPHVLYITFNLLYHIPGNVTAIQLGTIQCLQHMESLLYGSDYIIKIPDVQFLAFIKTRQQDIFSIFIFRYENYYDEEQSSLLLTVMAVSTRSDNNLNKKRGCRVARCGWYASRNAFHGEVVLSTDNLPWAG